MKVYENLKKSFEKPTVGEVFHLMKKAANNYNLAVWQDVHQLIGISDRTFRRYKKGADINPDARSSIGFQSYVLLYATAELKSYIQPIEFDIDMIPPTLIMNAENFSKRGISKEQIHKLVGRNSLSGITVREMAANVGISTGELTLQTSKDDSPMSFSTWALILLFHGVPVERIFYLSETANKACSDYREEKKKLDVSDYKARLELAEKYLEKYPFFRGNPARALPLNDFYWYSDQKPSYEWDENHNWVKYEENAYSGQESVSSKNKKISTKKMQLIDRIIERIEEHPDGKPTQTLVLALASACSSVYRVSLIDVAIQLDAEGKLLVQRLANIAQEPDFSNSAQDNAIKFLKMNGFIK